MVDTAGSLCHAADALVDIGGAKEIYACASHGVLSGPALERIENDVVSLAGKKGFSFSTKAGDFLFRQG